jgi:hypothetical protein
MFIASRRLLDWFEIRLDHMVPHEEAFQAIIAISGTCGTAEAQAGLITSELRTSMKEAS